MTALPELLDAGQVAARYGMRDRRAARRVMDQAGAFRVGGRLLIRADRLDAWERAAADSRRREAAPKAEAPGKRGGKHAEPALAGADWWRE